MKHAGLWKLSAATAQRMGLHFISSEMAAIVLEWISIRRNLHLTQFPSDSRTSIVPTTMEQAVAIVHYALRVLPAGASDHALAMLGVIHDAFADMERTMSPATFDADDMPNDQQDMSMPRRDRTDIPDGAFARSVGVKRCTRCGKIKASGSGHGRSECDDGFSISSAVPYPAYPAVVVPVVAPA